MKIKSKIIIAGPCAVESKDQIISCSLALKKIGIGIVRASLWKPRTRPGFEGVGLGGISWLSEITRLGTTVATEILLPEQLVKLIKEVDKDGDLSKILIWIGSRNQNHMFQKEIAKIIKERMPNEVKLLIKNQVWEDENHWLGIVDHVLESKISPERLILCHRGFSAFGQDNPENFRNPPDFEMAMRVKEKTGLPMLIDPSHIGGTTDNVFKIIRKTRNFDFDGMMVEAHPNPSSALTDKKQQLNFKQLNQLLNIF